MKLTPLFTSLGLAALLGVGCQPKTVANHYLSATKYPQEIQATENKLEKFYYMLCGEFSNKAQSAAKNDPIFQEQEIIAIPIWQNERRGEYWLYMGWFKHGVPDRALAQGIFQLSRLSPDTFKLKFHLPPDEAAHNYYSLEWQKPNPFADLKPKDLEHDPTCVNYVVQRAAGEFEIISGPSPCKRYMSEALRYFDFQAKITTEGQWHFTQFFDANQTKVFEYSRPDGMQYMRLPKDAPTYRPDAKEVRTKGK